MCIGVLAKAFRRPKQQYSGGSAFLNERNAASEDQGILRFERFVIDSFFVKIDLLDCVTRNLRENRTSAMLCADLHEQ